MGPAPTESQVQNIEMSFFFLPDQISCQLTRQNNAEIGQVEKADKLIEYVFLGKFPVCM